MEVNIMKNRVLQRINTERLSIRRIHYRDWRNLQKIYTDKLNSPYVMYDRAFNISDQCMKNKANEFGVHANGINCMAFGVYYEHKIIGYVTFYWVNILTGYDYSRYIVNNKRTYEIAYSFISEDQHKGFATEAIDNLMTAIRDKVDVNCFIIRTSTVNTPSVNLAKRLRFKLKSIDNITLDGKNHFDSALFIRR